MDHRTTRFNHLPYRGFAAALTIAAMSASLLVACNEQKQAETPAEPAKTDATASGSSAAGAPAQDSVVASEEKAGETREVVSQSGATTAYPAAPTAAPMAGLGTAAYNIPPPENTERYPDAKPNAVKIAAEEPVSTFSIDVDTASYGVMRRYLNQGSLPPRDAVRVEEMVNYFDYSYALPETRETPFATTVQVYPTPWNKETLLLHIGIKGYDIPVTKRPPANLVLLLDVSGSMQDEDKLPLLKKSIRLLVNELDAQDTVAMVVYAGAAGTVLEPTPGDQKSKILAALDQLEAGGSTAGGEGIRQAYQLAELNFAKGKVNRILLATDGDFNVGIADPERLEDFVAEKRKTGIFLTVLGFGGGNYNDTMMQTLAQAGNGNAAFIDTLNEARKVLVDEMTSTLFTIAKDVKIQVEFNPQQVAEYRLIGYETRLLDRTDFNNDKVDAGDIGAGHTVTALYEVTPVGSKAQLSDPLRYGKAGAGSPTAAKTDELAFLRIRYKLPDQDTSKLIERAIGAKERVADFAQVNADLRFAASVAAFGQLLKGDDHMGTMTLAEVRTIAQNAKGDDPFGYRAEFVNLVRTAESAGALPPLEQPNPVMPN